MMASGDPKNVGDGPMGPGSNEVSTCSLFLYNAPTVLEKSAVFTIRATPQTHTPFNASELCGNEL